MRFGINNEIWTIEFVEWNNNKLYRSDGSISLAVTDNNTKTIYINESVYGALLEKIICHEVCHVFCFAYSIYIPVELEEIICDFLATYGREVFNVADDVINRFMRCKIYGECIAVA